MVRSNLIAVTLISIAVSFAGLPTLARSREPVPELNRVRIVKEYFQADTLKQRDECIALVQAELQLQLDAWLKHLKITAHERKNVWFGTEGVVTDDSQGIERFKYAVLVKAEKSGAKAELRLDYDIYSQVWTTAIREPVGEELDSLGNVTRAGTMRTKVIKTIWIQIPAFGQKVLEVFNSASNKVVARLNDPIPGEPVDYLGNPKRLSNLECRRTIQKESDAN